MPRMNRAALIVAAAIALSGCDATETKLADTAPVSVRLALTGGGAAKASADGPIVLAGTDGTLSVTDVRFILDGFSLAGSGPIEAGPIFVDVPLDLESLELFVAEVPLGSYSAVSFQINGLGTDEDDLAAQVRTDFPDWPDEASVAIVGSFAPADASPVRPFTIYIGADVDVSVSVDPPFELEEEHVEKVLTLGVDLLEWLPEEIDHDLDISGYDYGMTGEVIPFAFELDQAFTIEPPDGSDD